MRVIGVGFGRTGTASLRTALDRLGYGPCYHMHEVMAAPSRAADWLADDPPWDTIFQGYGSTLDWPGAAYWRELVAHYPDARVILTVRDPERWYRSMDATILRAIRQLHSPVAGRLIRAGTLLRPELGGFLAMIDRLVLGRSFGGDLSGGRERFTRLFTAHTAEVIRTVPADRLLVLDVAEGWAPLCDFLGVPIPGEPFPHVNDQAEFARISGGQRRKALLPLLAVTGAAAAIGLGLGAAALRRRKRA